MYDLKIGSSIPVPSTDLGVWFYTTIQNTSTFMLEITKVENNNMLNMFQAIVDGTGKALGAYLLVWVMIEGYKILWGGSKQSITNFMWDASLKCIFIALAFNANGWINLVYQAFEGIREYVSSKNSSSGDILWGKASAGWGGMMGDMAHWVWIESPITKLPINMFLVFFAFLGFFVGLFPVMRHFFINSISFLVLMVVSPIAFYFLIFKVSASAFGQWLKMILSNILTLTFLIIFVGLVFNYIYKDLVVVQYQNFMFETALKSLFYGIFLNITTTFCAKIAESLMTISLEGIAGSAMGRAMGIAGSTAGLAMGGAMLGKNLAMKGASAVGSSGSAVVKGGASALANTNTGKSVLNSAPAQMAKNMGQSVASEASKTYQKAKDIAGKINDYAKK